MFKRYILIQVFSKLEEAQDAGHAAGWKGPKPDAKGRREWIGFYTTMAEHPKVMYKIVEVEVDPGEGALDVYES